uniref:Putative membrane protein n=2 Tax=environmental samples TaxID=651140 RepID=A0A075GMB9_9ARCH|nr:putative membrane protein [uncultured marine thaumarchaeote KM3_15_E09]AIF05669.1 putative membrane protein [uncultured marine thaumarchaeote KM3_186_C08]
MSLSGKLQKDIEVTTASKLLVICVDRDDDLGRKTGISTPVVGRDACIEAAQRLALEDPEDADSNSIFFAVKTYEDLVSKGYKVQVITVTGVENRGVQADEKVASQIKSVLKKFSANGAVIVSDGEDDEMVIPVIQNVIPVISVQRVVMQVSRTIEHSYAVFGKFLKLVMYNPKYSKFFLGVPGILLLIGGIGAVTGYNAEIFAVLVTILGGAFLIRAFDIDKAWANWAKPTPEGFTRMFTLITGLILIAASVPAGIATVSAENISGDLGFVNLITDKVVIGQFVSGMIPFLWIGIGTIFVGILFSNWLNRKLRHFSDILRIVVLVALYPTVHQFTNILMYDESSFSLILPLVAGFAVTAASATLLIRRYRKKGSKELEQ